MDQIVLYAHVLHDINGGPNYKELCRQAAQLMKKRKRDNQKSTSTLVSRANLLISNKKYTTKRPTGTQQISKFITMLSQVDVLYKKRSIGQREFHEAFT
jgi:hypothetical protein